MENLNKKQGHGKTPQQYKDSSILAWYGVVGMIILLFFMSLCSCSPKIQADTEWDMECSNKRDIEKNYVITEWDGDREIRWYSAKK